MNILISGFGCNDEYFFHFSKKFTCYTIYHLDYNKNINDYLFDLLKLCDQYSQINLIGFSMGCHIVLLFEKYITAKLNSITLISPTNIFFWWPTSDCCMQFPKHFEPLKALDTKNIQYRIRFLHYVSKFTYVYQILTYIYYYLYSIKAKEPFCLIKNMAKMDVIRAWKQIKSIMIDINFYNLIRNVTFKKRISIITGTRDYNFEFCKLLQDMNISKHRLTIIHGANHHMLHFESDKVYSCLWQSQLLT